MSIDDNIFWQNIPAGTTDNCLRASIRPDGGAHDYEISGNMFLEMGTGIIVPAASGAVHILDNRFLLDSDAAQTTAYAPINNNNVGSDIDLLPAETYMER
jgi:hypothetical protein